MTLCRKVTTMRRKATSFSITIAVLALTLVGTLSTAVAQSDSSGHIEGSWIFAITPSAETGRAPFTAVASFAAGGVFLATGSNDRLGGPISPLYGSWKQIGRGRFGSTTHMFAFDPAGNPVAMLKTNQVFQLKNRNELVGLGDLSVCDVQGENCVTPPGSIQITGKRITIERLVIN
jgi:hypothetical protein